jgi:hypothetical protein
MLKILNQAESSNITMNPTLRMILIIILSPIEISGEYVRLPLLYCAGGTYIALVALRENGLMCRIIGYSRSACV